MDLGAIWTSGRYSAHGRELELNDLSGPLRPSPFCDSTMHLTHNHPQDPCALTRAPSDAHPVRAHAGTDTHGHGRAAGGSTTDSARRSLPGPARPGPLPAGLSALLGKHGNPSGRDRQSHAGRASSSRKMHEPKSLPSPFGFKGNF